MTAFQSAAEQVDFIPKADAAKNHQSDLNSVEVQDFELLPMQQHGAVFFKPVDHGVEYLVPEALVCVTLAVTASVTKSFELTARLFVTFEGELTAPTVLGVDAEFGRRRRDLDYGAVGPDWHTYQEQFGAAVGCVFSVPGTAEPARVILRLRRLVSWPWWAERVLCPP